MPVFELQNDELLVEFDSEGNLVRVDAWCGVLGHWFECTEIFKQHGTLMEEANKRFESWEVDRALDVADNWIKFRNEEAI